MELILSNINLFSNNKKNETMKFLLTVTGLFFFMFSANAQFLTIKIGANYNTTIQKQIPELVGVSLGGFDPKYGYQAGLAYKQPLLRSFFLGIEIGYLNKGHQRISSITQKNLGDVNYNYWYLAPSVGYDFPFGISIKMGIGFNRLINHDGSTIGVIQNNDNAFSTALAYNYKRIGLELGYNKSLKPMQKINLAGQGFEHYHEWYNASLTYNILKKRTKTP
jgi:hypothetical protein